MRRLYLLVFLLLAACGQSGSPAQHTRPWPDGETGRPQVGHRAPNFQLAATTGSEMELAAMRGKPVVVNFFATWCTPCRREMPLLERARTSIQVVGIDVLEDAAKVADFGRQQGVNYPLLLDTTGDIKDSYRVSSLPATFFIDSEGTIRDVVLGEVKEPQLREILARLGASPLH